MIKIDYKYVAQAKTAGVEELRSLLQQAIELEHATIPAYLTALYSVKEGHNREAADILRSIVVEEMLHMTIAANVLNAIGGSPAIADPKFVPSYPGPLPMNIGDGLVVGLGKLSREAVANVFMKIEEPEYANDYPVEMAFKAEAVPQYATIGQFYEALIEAITRLGKCIFTGDPKRQVVNPQWFPEDQLFAVTSPDSACRALEVIRLQGEGTSKSPLDDDGALAHYYRFAQIYYGRKLIPAKNEQGYAYAGDPVPLDQLAIWDLLPNGKAEDYPVGSQARTDADLFNRSYTSLLNGLHAVFNGQPDNLNQTIGIMFEMRLLANQLIRQVDPKTGKNCTPPFQFIGPAA